MSSYNTQLVYKNFMENFVMTTIDSLCVVGLSDRFEMKDKNIRDFFTLQTRRRIDILEIVIVDTS